MTCQKCKGLGNIAKANPSTGEFEIKDCICRTVNHKYYDNFTGSIIEVTEVVGEVMSILESYNNSGQNYRRIINRFLFDEHLKNGTLIPHPQE